MQDVVGQPKMQTTVAKVCEKTLAADRRERQAEEVARTAGERVRDG